MIKLNEIIDCQTIFGDFLFFGNGKAQEKMTYKEKEIYDKLISFISGEYVSKNKEELKQYLQILMKCKKQFPELIPESTELYRGTTIPKKNMGHILKNLKKIDDMIYKFNRTVVYIPKDIIQSWSSSFKKAEIFSSINYKNSKEKYPIILKSKFRRNELLFNSSFVSMNLNSFSEQEIIRIGKSCNCEIYITTSLINRFKKQFNFKND